MRTSPTTRATRPGRTTRRAAPSGFTLLEVMIGLALLGLGLTVLIKGAAGNIFNSQQAHMIGVVTDLARGKMYDIEDKLIKDGFSDTEQHEEDQAFTDEGWPSIHYSYKIEVVELPGFDTLQSIVQGKGSGAGSGSGEGGIENSVLGQALSQASGGMGGLSGLGGGSGKGGGDIGAALGGSFVQTYYTMFQQILKESLRKVTLTVTWQVMGSERDMKVVAFFTDAAAMDKVLSGAGRDDLDDVNAAKGSNKGGSNNGGGAGGGGAGGGGAGGGGNRSGSGK